MLINGSAKALDFLTNGSAKALDFLINGSAKALLGLSPNFLMMLFWYVPGIFRFIYLLVVVAQS